MPNPTTADALNSDFLNIRSRLIDLAAALDRVERATGQVSDDPRWESIQQALKVISSPAGNRAEKALRVFSLPYSPDWQKDYGI